MFAPIIQRVVACDGPGLLRTAYTSPRRGIPLPRGSACAVSHDLDGLIPPGLCDLFQPLTSMGFGVPAPLGIPRIAPRCPSTGGGGSSSRLPGYGASSSPVHAPRCTAETAHLLAPGVTPMPRRRSQHRGARSGSGPLSVHVSQRLRPAGDVRTPEGVRPCLRRASASQARDDPKALSLLLAGEGNPAGSLRSVPSRVAPGSRVPTARPRFTANEVPVPPGSGPPRPSRRREPVGPAALTTAPPLDDSTAHVFWLALTAARTVRFAPLPKRSCVPDDPAGDQLPAPRTVVLL